MELISGTAIAEEIKNKLKMQNLDRSIVPCLGVILVGDNKESLIYVGLKQKAVEAIGGKLELIHLPENTSKQELLARIKTLNEQPEVHGILVQLPLPPGLDKYQEQVLETIRPDKDVDGFTPHNRGLLMGDKSGFISCAVMAVIEVIDRIVASVAEKRVLLIGDSFDLIKPLAVRLISRLCLVTVIPEYDSDWAQASDIVVVEKGSALLVQGKDLKEGALVIDAGFHWHNNRICGNVDRDSLKGVTGYLLPVPGGLGPLLIAKLMENLTAAADQVTVV